MSYQEKKIVVSLFSTLFIFGWFCAYVLQQYQEGAPADVFKFWGAAIVMLIPISIVVNIFITIVFNMIHRAVEHEVEPSFADERDQIIELKATRNSHYVFVIGFVMAMGTLVLELNPSVMFTVLIGSGFLSQLVGACTQLYLYRRGV